jgi:hypothetical protein
MCVAVSPLQASVPRPSRQQKDDGLALANINQYLQPKKKTPINSAPGPNIALFGDTLAQRNRAEGELEYQLSVLRRSNEDRAPSCHGPNGALGMHQKCMSNQGVLIPVLVHRVAGKSILYINK